MLNDMVVVYRTKGKFKGFYRMFTEAGAQDRGIPYLHWKQAIFEDKMVAGRWILIDGYMPSEKSLQHPLPPMVCQVISTWRHKKTLWGIIPTDMFAIRIKTYTSIQGERKIVCRGRGLNSKPSMNVFYIHDIFRNGIEPEHIAFMENIHRRLFLRPDIAREIFFRVYVTVFMEKPIKYYLKSKKRVEAITRLSLIMYQKLMHYRECGLPDSARVSNAFRAAHKSDGDVINLMFDLAQDASMGSKDRKDIALELGVMAELRADEKPLLNAAPVNAWNNNQFINQIPPPPAQPLLEAPGEPGKYIEAPPRPDMEK